MEAFVDEEVFVELEGVEGDASDVERAGAAAGEGDAGDGDGADVVAGEEAEAGVFEEGVENVDDVAAIGDVAGEAEAGDVEDGGVDGAGPFEDGGGAFGFVAGAFGAGGIGGVGVAAIEEEGAGEGVLVGGAVIDFSEQIVAGGDLVDLGDVLAGVAIAEERAVGQRHEGEDFGDGGIDVDVAGAEAAEAGVGGEGVDDGGGGEEFADAFVVGEPEGFVFDDGATGGGAELVAAEEGAGGGVEEVAGVEGGVAVEVEEGAVEVVGAGAGDGVEDATGGAAVFGGVVVRHDGEFADGFDAQVGAEDGAGGVVGVVVEGDAVEAVVVFRGAGAGDGELDAVAGADAAVAAHGGDAWLEGGELGPIATVEGEFADGEAFDGAVVGGRGEIDGADGGVDFDGFGDIADGESEIDGDFGADVEDDVLAETAGEAGGFEGGFVGAGLEVGGAVGTGFIAQEGPCDAGVDVAEGDFRGGDDGALGVTDDAENGAADGLRGEVGQEQ